MIIIFLYLIYNIAKNISKTLNLDAFNLKFIYLLNKFNYITNQINNNYKKL